MLGTRPTTVGAPDVVLTSSVTSRVAIIAGAGAFPFHVAREAKRQGLWVFALGVQGWADGHLAGHVDAYEEVAVGQLGHLIDRLRAHGVSQAIMAGKVTKDVLFTTRLSFDTEALGVLSQIREYSVSALLGAIAERLSRDGIVLLDSSTFLKANLCPEGVLTTCAPDASEQADIQVGWAAARALAQLDVGQTVVVKGRVVVAVEALEGTDATIQRAHELVGGGVVVVKVASPNQDRRFDLPVVGPETMAVLRKASARCLAVEAGITLLLDREQLIAQANAAGVCLIGMKLPDASAGG